MYGSMSTTADERLATALRAAGHRVTSQRLVLYRVLRELGRHAHAEEIARVSSERLPGLSLPTVYATLELFEGLGLVRRVDAGGPAALFDPRTDPHAHFACRGCGTVSDLDAAVDASAVQLAARASGAEPDHVEVVLRGLCAACRAS
jgi:Fe2+ or Zn2+ uptake regulation protein